MARVRSIRVGGRRYLQVVEAEAGSLSVLQSFGEYNLENWVRANHFANSWNQLRDLAQSPESKQDPDLFFKAALAIFGVILGAKIIESLLAEK